VAERIARVPSWRWWLAHVVGGGALLVAVSAAVGFDGYFFIDEGALYGQLEVMEDRGGWTIQRPFPDRDPTGEHVPMAKADIAGDRYAPFAKHPVHVILATAADAVGGQVGVRLLSSLGVLVAGLGAAAMVGGDAFRRAAAFWITVAASPLLFDAQLVVAHALGAGVAAAVFAAVTGRLERRPSVAVAIAACGASFGGLLRNEFVLLAIAAALVFATTGWRRRDRWHALAGVGFGFGGVVAYLVEPRLIRAAIGGRAELDAAPSGGSGLGQVLEAAGRSLFEAGGGTSPAATLGIVLAGALTAAFVVFASRGRPDVPMLWVLAVGALVGGVAFLRDPQLVTGLVWTFPALWLLLPVLRHGLPRETPVRAGVLVAGVFAILVAATQYSTLGGLEWGWRYVAIAVPLVTPALAQVAADLWVRPGVPRLALLSVLAVGSIVSVGGLRVQATLLRDTDTFLAAASEVSGSADADWIVSTDASFGRFAYDLSVRGRVATANGGTEDDVLGWLHADGVDRVLLIWRSVGDEVPEFKLGSFRRTGAVRYIASGYRAIVVVS